MLTSIRIIGKAQLTNKDNNSEYEIGIETDCFFNNELITILDKMPYDYGTDTLTIGKLLIKKEDYHALINCKSCYSINLVLLDKTYDNVVQAYSLSFDFELQNPTSDLLRLKYFIKSDDQHVILSNYKADIAKGTIQFQECVD